MPDSVSLDAPSIAPVVSDAEAAFLTREGFLAKGHALDGPGIAAFRAAMKDIRDRNPEMSDVATVPYVPYRGRPNEGVIGGEQLFRFAVHPIILAAVRKLLGPDVLLWGGEILVKGPGGKGSDWHQDGVVRTLRPGKGRDRARGVNVWIAMDDVDTENGCLHFVPGTSELRLLDHQLEQNGIDDVESFPFSPDTSAMRLDEAVAGVFPAGHFSMHDLFVIHGSNTNRSGKRRVALTLRYLDANDAFDRSFAKEFGTAVSLPAGTPIWLVLGENRDSRNDFTIGHEGLEELDRMAEESRRLFDAA